MAVLLLTEAQQGVEGPLARREARVLPLPIVGHEPGPAGVFHFLTHFIHLLVYIKGGKQHFWWPGTHWRKGVYKRLGRKLELFLFLSLKQRIL